MKFVIISHRMFESTLAPFVAWKKKQGFNTILRFTDEAEVGNTSAAIKSYLQGLYTSATPENPAPSFVMLVGDNEQLPAFSGTTSSHVSDLYFATYDGSSDRIPDVNIGRMSAKTVAHLEPLIQKTLLLNNFKWQIFIFSKLTSRSRCRYRLCYNIRQRSVELRFTLS